MGKPSTKGAFGRERTKRSLECIKQKDDYGCGAACLNSYWTDGLNYRHWMILQGRVESRVREELVVCADPLLGDWVVRPWPAICADGIVAMYQVKAYPGDSPC